MRFSTFIAALLPLGAAMAEIIDVMVGANGTLAYSPSEVTAQNGDMIRFTFVSKNHTVTQSSFAAPCTNLSADGLDSGFQNIPDGSTTFMQYSFNMTNVTGPLWFYCRQTGHCAKGMVFAVNPTAEKNFTAFQQAAMATASNTSNTTSTSPSGTTGSSSSASPSASGTTTTNNNGAMGVKAGGALLLSGLGLVAGLVL